MERTRWWVCGCPGAGDDLWGWAAGAGAGAGPMGGGSTTPAWSPPGTTAVPVRSWATSGGSPGTPRGPGRGTAVPGTRPAGSVAGRPGGSPGTTPARSAGAVPVTSLPGEVAESPETWAVAVPATRIA